jgi:hypothetical protein
MNPKTTPSGVLTTVWRKIQEHIIRDSEGYKKIQKDIIRFRRISASADRGHCSRVCARETLRPAPHRHYQKFFGTHVFRVTFKHLTQPQLRSHIWCFGTLGQLLKIPPLVCPNKYNSAGGVGVPIFLFLRASCQVLGPFWNYPLLAKTATAAPFYLVAKAGSFGPRGLNYFILPDKLEATT